MTRLTLHIEIDRESLSDPDMAALKDELMNGVCDKLGDFGIDAGHVHVTEEKQ